MLPHTSPHATSYSQAELTSVALEGCVYIHIHYDVYKYIGVFFFELADMCGLSKYFYYTSQVVDNISHN